MKTVATVIETPEKEIAIVRVERQSACEGCHRATEEGGCSVCTLLGGKNAAHAQARNTVGAVVGDRVEIESRTGRILLYAALVFLVPVVALIAGYLVGGAIGGEIAALIGAGSLFLLSLTVLYCYSRFVVAKRVDIEIVSVVTKHTES